jgi:hypothetical protein
VTWNVSVPRDPCVKDTIASQGDAIGRWWDPCRRWGLVWVPGSLRLCSSGVCGALTSSSYSSENWSTTLPLLFPSAHFQRSKREVSPDQGQECLKPWARADRFWLCWWSHVFGYDDAKLFIQHLHWRQARLMSRLIPVRWCLIQTCVLVEIPQSLDYCRCIQISDNVQAFHFSYFSKLSSLLIGPLHTPIRFLIYLVNFP